MYELGASFGLNRQVVSINIGSGVDCLTSGDSRHFANRGSENDQAGNNIAVTEEVVCTRNVNAASLPAAVAMTM